MARNAEPKCDTETADENVYLVAMACVSNCFPTCQRLILIPLTRSNSAASRTDDIVSVELNPIQPAVSLVAFPGSEDCGTLPRDKRVRSPADGSAQRFLGKLGRTCLAPREILDPLARA